MNQQLSDEMLNILVDKSLGKKTKQLDPLLEELIQFSMNDPNSSQLREAITAKVAGCISIPGKKGRDALDEKTGREKEIKPKNYTGKATNGGGCFNDYTRARLEKDKQYGLEIIHSLFVDGRVVYVLEFDFDAIAEKLERQIIEKCEVHGNDYVRTASWYYTDWINHPSLKIHYIDFDLIDSTKCVNKNLNAGLKRVFKQNDLELS